MLFVESCMNVLLSRYVVPAVQQFQMALFWEDSQLSRKGDHFQKISRRLLIEKEKVDASQDIFSISVVKLMRFFQKGWYK